MEAVGVNQVSRSWLRSYIGKWQSAASLLFALRPWVGELTAVLYDRRPSNADDHRVWVNQFRHTLAWLANFIDMENGPVVRTFRVGSYFNRGVKYGISMDASIYGMGAVLIVNGVPEEYFSIAMTSSDERISNMKKGDKDGQQIWESLVLLIAIRHWCHRWREARVTLQLESDNVAALTLAAQLKAHGARRKIATQLALIYSSSVFEPDIVSRLPGVMNVTPDSLSRRFQHSDWVPPASLRDAKEVHPALRTTTWWRTETPPFWASST